jgi:hypothetical protein
MLALRHASDSQEMGHSDERKSERFSYVQNELMVVWFTTANYNRYHRTEKAALESTHPHP